MEKKIQAGDITHYHGVLLCSSVSSGTVVDISMPPLPHGCFTLEARDIPGTNSLKVLDERMPILASTSISYTGQPLLALFGPDMETVRAFTHFIRFSYALPAQNATEEKQDASPSTDDSVETHGIKALVHEWAKTGDVPPEEETAVFNRTYSYPMRPFPRKTALTVQADYNQKELSIHVSTQWPVHVRDSVAEAVSMPKKKVLVRRLPYFTTHDAYVLWPSLLAAVAAAAAVKVGRKVTLQHTPALVFPAYTIHRRTVFHVPTGKLLTETTEAVIDQGAFPFFSEELQRHVMTGLIPPYSLLSGSFTVRVRTSENPPAFFAGDLGYASALSSTEAHYSTLASTAHISPIDWKIKNLADYPARGAYITTPKLPVLREIISETAEKSGFQRKYAAFELQRQRRNRYSVFLNYARGIGNASGAGISGFSSSFDMSDKYSVALKLGEKDKAYIDTSFPLNSPSEAMWKHMVTQVLDIDADSILPASEHLEELRDSGPAVLSANSGRLPLLFKKAAEEIKERRFKDPLPIEAAVSFRSPALAVHTEFEGTSWGSLTIELDISTITLRPMVRHVWASFSFGYVEDEKLLKSRIRQTIVATIRDMGAFLDYRDGNRPFDIDLAIHNTEDGVPASINSLLRSLVMGAFLSALAQALPVGITRLPVETTQVLDSVKETQS